MRPIGRDELWPLERYDRERDAVRRDVMAEKDRRRLEAGEHVTVLFENRRTVWYQIQEMLRAERIFEDAGVRHELATYNELVPGPAELTATLMIQYADPEERDRRLRALVGLHDRVALEVDGRRIPASFDHRQFDVDRVSAVQFVRFALGAPPDGADFARLGAAGRIAFVVDHPELTVRTPLSAELSKALGEDLLQR